MSDPRAYPARTDAALDEPLSRWLWLVKWLLLIPHYLCLAVLWVVFLVLTVFAFFAILVTGRYPPTVFDLTVGILRWGWRVAYYGDGAFGTDRYPPFTVRDVPDYPAHFEVEYPERLSRGLVLVKWWLLAIPHYLVLSILCGGGLWWYTADDSGDGWRWSVGAGGLIGLLALVAAVILLVTGSYSRSLFDLLLGLNRWVLRVIAYAALMTDRYPPFRLDLGGADPGTAGGGPPGAEPGTEAQLPAGAAAAPARSRWTAGRTVTGVVGALVLLLGTAPLLGGLALVGADRLGRDDAGFLTTPDRRFVAAGRAVVTDGLPIEADGPDWVMPDRTLGTVRVRVTPADPNRPVFVGIAPADVVAGWLAGSSYETVKRVEPEVQYTAHLGTVMPAAPATQDFWVAQSSGTGAQTLDWEVASGEWTIVVLNADASPGVDVRADLGATVPALGWIATGLIVLGAVLILVGVTLLVVAVASARERRPLVSEAR